MYRVLLVDQEFRHRISRCFSAVFGSNEKKKKKKKAATGLNGTRYEGAK
jgi:hypothetical protein